MSRNSSKTSSTKKYPSPRRRRRRRRWGPGLWTWPRPARTTEDFPCHILLARGASDCHILPHIDTQFVSRAQRGPPRHRQQAPAPTTGDRPHWSRSPAWHTRLRRARADARALLRISTSTDLLRRATTGSRPTANHGDQAITLLRKVDATERQQAPRTLLLKWKRRAANINITAAS